MKSTPEFTQPQLPFDEIPYGYCKCGCGQLAPIATRNRHSRGVIKGQPQRYIPYHFHRAPLEDRFWAKVLKTDSCWLWQGGKSRGYGEITLGQKTMLTHRLSYELHHGPIPNGMEICHKCDNPPCCNPDHLFLGTHADNMRDLKEKGKGRHDLATYTRGEKVHTAILTVDQVKEIRRLRAEKGMKYQALAAQFGVSKWVIYSVITRRSWKHV